MSDALLQCQGLVKTYEETNQAVQVIKGLDFSVHAGQQLAIVGSSGSGKSTLLHLLGGLDKPSSGEVLIAGQSVAKLSDAACGRLRNKVLGFVYQFHHLLPEFTALENVAMPLLIRNESVANAKAQATTMLEKVGLAERLEHKPAELSGGERQRAAIARAMVTKPACILADEPTGNLDSRNAEQVYELLLELNQSMQTALVVVTHDYQLANRMQQLYELIDGKLLRQTAS